MTFRLRSHQKNRVHLSLGLKALIIISLLIGDIAIIQADKAISQSVWDRLRFAFRRPDGTPSGRRRGGAVRDPDLCPALGAGQSPLTALVPSRSDAVKTTDPSPMFWFYVPYTMTGSNPEEFTLEFVLQTEDYIDVYKETFTLPETISPGVLGLRPQLGDTLEPGDIYHWYFLIYCRDAQQIYEPAFVQGTVVREVPQSGTNQSVGDRPSIDNLEAHLLAQAEAGRWLDVINTLSELYPDNPTETDAWRNALNSIDLEPEIQTAPLSGRFYIPN